MSIKIKIARATGIIIIATLVSQIIAFLKEIIVAAKFGVGMEMDAFFIALIIPSLLSGLLLSSLEATFIPVFVNYKTKKKEKDAFTIASTMINILLIVLCIVVLFFIFLAPYIIPLLAPGFNAEALHLAIRLTRVLLPMMIFMALFGLSKSIINSYKDFTLPALAPLVFTVTIIAALFILTKLGIMSLAIGSVAGAFFQFAILIPRLKSKGLKYRFKLNLHHPGVKRVWCLALPLFIGASISSVNIVVDRIMASTLVEGSVAALGYADKLIQVPFVIFIFSITTVILPFFAYQISKEKIKELKKTLSFVVRNAGFILIPITIGVMVLSVPLVRLLFQRGMFDQRATMMTSQALFYYAIGLFIIALAFILVRVYHALQDVKTLLKISIMSVVLNIVLNFILMKPLAHAGIALSTSLTYLITTTVLILILRRKIGSLRETEVGSSIVKILAASLIMGVVAFFVIKNLEKIWALNLASQIINMVITVIISMAVYFAFVFIFRIKEGREILAIIKGIKRG